MPPFSKLLLIFFLKTHPSPKIPLSRVFSLALALSHSLTLPSNLFSQITAQNSDLIAFDAFYLHSYSRFTSWFIFTSFSSFTLRFCSSDGICILSHLQSEIYFTELQFLSDMILKIILFHINFATFSNLHN